MSEKKNPPAAPTPSVPSRPSPTLDNVPPNREFNYGEKVLNEVVTFFSPPPPPPTPPK